MKERWKPVSVVVCCLFLLTACSHSWLLSGGSPNQGGETSDGRTEVVMWNLFGGGDAEYMQDIVNAFNESQSDYYIHNIMQENAEYYTKLLTSMGAGRGPDIAIAHDYVLAEFVNQDLLFDIGELDQEDVMQWEDFNQNILQSTVFDDKHVAVPIDTHSQIMYVNNELVDGAGLLNEDGSIDMEESPQGFVDFFVTLKGELDGEQMPFALSTNGSDPFWLWWTFYTQLGGEHILSEESIDDTSYALEEDKAIEAAELVRSLFQEHEVIPLNQADFYGNFQSGKSAVITTGVWATGIWETTDGLDFTPMPIPTLFDEEGAWGSSHTLILPAKDEVNEEVVQGAIQFLEFATDHGEMWAKAGHIPSKDTVVESEAFQSIPYRSDYAEVADYVNFLDQTIYTRGLQTVMQENLDRIWSGDISPEEAFDQIERDVEDLID
ncbi:extracellular solute-binding protein [Gracilibacillus timonensis]|uniref:extracellular solute-binding protein n=1 Tax=Gracilibacillus timonensis TaxID=1816696 RepID=UPI0008266EBE|nr:extracellular solute-binding protein [Gracilibacillus timonensis]